MMLLNLFAFMTFGQSDYAIPVELNEGSVLACSLQREITLVQGDSNTFFQYDFIQLSDSANRPYGIFLAAESLSRTKYGTYGLGGNAVLHYDFFGNLRWKYELGHEARIPLVLCTDVNRDDVTDLIVMHGKYSKHDQLTNTITADPSVIITVIDGQEGEAISEVILGPEQPLNMWSTFIDNTIDVNHDGSLDIIVLDNVGGLVAVEPQTGRILWSQRFVSNEEYRYIFPFDVIGLPPQPTISEVNQDSDFRIYVAFFPYLFCVDANTGEIVWRYELGEGSFVTTPIIMTYDHDSIPIIIVATGDWGHYKQDLCVYALGAERGEPLWTSKSLGEFAGDRLINTYALQGMPLVMVTAVRSHRLYLVEGMSGLMVGAYSLPFLVQQSIVYDVDGDGQEEVVFFSYDGYVYIYKWSVYENHTDSIENSIRQLNSIPEDSVWVWEYGAFLPVLEPLGYCAGNGEHRLQTLADVDQDGFAELITLTTNLLSIDDKALRILNIDYSHAETKD